MVFEENKVTSLRWLLFVGIAGLLFVGIATAKDPTIRNNPLTTVQTCGTDEYATLTYQGIECKATTDTWKNECNTPADCCDSGELLKITPTGLQCYPFTNKTSTYTTPFCADCCGASEFAVITTLGLRCAGSSCTKDSDCASPTPTCDTAIGRCVPCTKDSHCSGSSNYCRTDVKKCETCTWDSTYSCSNNKRVKHCRLSDGTIKKTQQLSCSYSQVCKNGQCVAGKQCTATTANWTSGVRACTASLAATNHRSSRTVTDSTDPDTGTATYKCWDGSFTKQSSACGTKCAAKTATWTVGSNSCSASLAVGYPGQVSTITDTTGTTGSAAYQCGTTGAWTLNSGSTCSTSSNPVNPPPGSCSATTNSNCTLSTTSNGGSSGSCASGYTGSCSYTCSNGTWTQSSNSCTYSGSTPNPPNSCSPSSIGDPGIHFTENISSWCNEYSREKYKYLNNEKDVTYTGCNVPADKCPSTANSQRRYTYKVNWSYTSCTSNSDCASPEYCLDYGGNHWSSADYCTSGDTNCQCGEWVVNFCEHSCAYRYTVSYSGNNEYYFYQPSGLPQKYHNATVSFTCEPNSCNADQGKEDVDGSTTVTVGVVDNTDTTDGCSQGTNSSASCATISNYNKNTTWECEGDWLNIGADQTTTELPYCCDTGIICAAGQENTKGGSRISIKNDCSARDHAACASDEYCKKGKCVECLDNNDCSGSTPHCAINSWTISGENFCQECTRDTHCTDNAKPYCHRSLYAKRFFCAECTSDSHCSGSTPHCSTYVNTRGTCVAQ